MIDFAQANSDNISFYRLFKYSSQISYDGKGSTQVDSHLETGNIFAIIRAVPSIGVSKQFSEGTQPCNKDKDQEVIINGSSLHIISKLVFNFAEMISERQRRDIEIWAIKSLSWSFPSCPGFD